MDLKSDCMNEYEILMMVEADTPQLAREHAASELTALCISRPDAISSWKLAFVPPAPADSEEGRMAIRDKWNACLSQWLDDEYLIYQILLTARNYTGSGLTLSASEEVVNDWGFRTACARLGVLFGWPIRIYHLGVGITTEELLRDLMVHPQMWAITAVVS